MRVFVTGTSGYIGSVLAPLLLQQGYEVIGLDTGFYREGALYPDHQAHPKTRRQDIRHLSVSDLAGADAIVHMAELSNDPLGQLAPHITYAINHQGSVHLAKLAKEAGIQRFIYTSSCSVYGVAGSEDMHEDSPLNPQTDYARCKTLVEKDVSTMADDHFSPIFLRNATLFGPSPRMRFDIVLNNLAGLAWTQKEIKMISDGTPWRPLVHIEDACQAILCALAAPIDVIHNQVVNVGDTAQNYQVKTIAQIIATVFPGCQTTFGDQGADNRSYRVAFEKIHQLFPSFQCRWSAEAGAKQLYNLFTQIQLTPEMFHSRLYTRLSQLEHLIQTGEIDEHFLWVSPPSE